MTAGATVTGQVNTSISLEVTGSAEATSAPAAPPGRDTSAARTAIIPAGNPAATCADPLPGRPRSDLRE